MTTTTGWSTPWTIVRRIRTPNQLDFDDNGIGNVCDVLEFNTVSGTLTMEMHTGFNAGVLVTCDPQLPLEVVSGTVRLQLDDQAAFVGIELASLEFAPTGAPCQQNMNLSEYSFPDMVISYDGGVPFPVTVPHSMAAHDSGSVSGMSGSPHAMVVHSTLDVSSNMYALVPASFDLDIMGSWPIFSLTVNDGGSSGTLNWDAVGFALTNPIAVEFVEPFEFAFPLSFEDLTGTLYLSP